MLYDFWKSEENAAFEGWDFSHLDGRWESRELPWDYARIVKDALSPEMRLLDMGTGGGEFILALGHPFERVSVTEGYAPNVRLCRERLSPLGITVAEADGGGPLPFADGSFDMVINRHESYDAGEVARVLKPGGKFITQQVGAYNNHELACELLGKIPPPYPDHTLANAIRRFEESGFEISYSDEFSSEQKFFDVGAVVYFAKIIEWEFPGFSVDKCLGALEGLQRRLERDGFVSSVERRFILCAVKRRTTAPKL